MHLILAVLWCWFCGDDRDSRKSDEIWRDWQ